MIMRKYIQITEDIFKKLVLFFLLEETGSRHEIETYLENKLDRLVLHDLYSRYKTDPSEEERKKAIDSYLDKRGIPESFRYEYKPSFPGKTAPERVTRR